MIRKLQSLSKLPVAPDAARMSGGERRQQLIRVAMRVFSQKGFTGTTTKEIAAAASVNEALIFRHFPTKDDLYAAILDFKANEVYAGDWLEELRGYAERRDDEGLFRAVAMKKLEHYRRDEGHHFVRLMFYSALEGHDLAHVFLERQARPVYDFLCDYIRRRQEEDAFSKMRPGLIVSGFIGMLNHYIISGALFPKWELNIPDEEMIASVTSLFLDGVRSQAKTTKVPKRSARKRR